jgi:3-dehydroquinate synthase
MMTIRSRSHDYTVGEAPDLKTAVENIAAAGKTFAVVDAAMLEPPHADAFSSLPAENIFALTATEEAKSFERLGPLFTWLLERGFRRDCALLVAGGGVTQDIACFVATVLLRGIRWHYIPTTLLAQCDSCIGSKSSINLGRFKNQIGTFYPPNSITLVTDVLKTLPPDEIRSGLGEAIKLHLLAGPEEVAWLRDALAAFGTPHFSLREILWSSLRIKQPFIEEDEFDRARRNLLNYGHTFGHAYESATRYAIPHGIAVTLGVLTATFVSARLGWVDPAHFEQLRSWLRPFFTPYHERLKATEMPAIFAAMKLDKKNLAGKINCILTRGPGRMERVAIESEDELAAHLGEFVRLLP